MPSPIDEHPSNTNAPSRSRLKPGSACEECRRRKLRCDRKQPSCGLCAESGYKCHVAPSGPRGPKRGHMKALLTRISAVEERLVQKQPERMSSEGSVDLGAFASLPDWSYNDLDDAIQAGGGQSSPQLVVESHQDADENEEATARLSSENRNDSAIQSEAPPMVLTAVMSNMSSNAAMPLLPDLVHSDRDQLYFDRAHTFVPIMNEHRYYSWSHNCSKTDAQVCLQRTMWALATSSSAQPQLVGDMLYHSAVQGLDELEAKGNSRQTIDIMQVQAWILLAFYEFMRVDFRRGWMSAGRAFRLIQLMRLNELDLLDTTLTIPSMDWVDTEERRRTFWLAYSLDRFVSLSNGSSLTLSEQVAVRMPAPHVNFQSGQPVVTSFLSDVMLAQDTSIKDSFTEFIIMATICGRALSHRHQSMAWMIYPEPVQALCDRHQQIYAVLAPRIAALSLNHPPVTSHTDPILLFTHAMAQTMVLYMCRLIDEVMPVPDETNQAMLDECARSFKVALVEVVSLTKTLSQMSCFKVHPLCPIPLYICVDNLTGFTEGGGTFDEQLKVIFNALNSLKRINILGQHFQVGSTEDLSLPTSAALELPLNLQSIEKGPSRTPAAGNF